MKRISLFLIGFLIVSLTALNATTVAETPQYGGTVIVSNHSDVTALNPVWKYSPSAYFISQNIYSTLIISDYGCTVGHGPYGDLAKSWEVSDDGLTYTFHLHNNVYWHDGVEFSSADVKFTYDTIREKKYPLAKYLTIVKEILAPDDNTIVFKLSGRDASFLTMLAQASNWYGQILPKHLYEGTDIPKNPYNKTPVGTGPFEFVEMQAGQFVSVKANEKYFRGRPYMDKIIWRLYSSKEVAQADFRSGNIDMLAYAQAPPFYEIDALAAQPGVKLWTQRSIYDRSVQFNHTRKPLNDIRVREALCLAINRDEVSQIAFRGRWAPNYHAGTRHGAPVFTNVNVRWPKHDLKRAKQLLDEAGYPAGPDGIRMKFTIRAPDYFKDYIDVLIQQWKRVGVQVRFDISDTATYFGRIRAGNFDLNGYYSRYGPDPDAYREHFGTNGPRNFGKYSNPTVDRLLKKGRITFEAAKRKEIYDKVQEVLREDFAYLPVTEAGYFTFAKDKLHGIPMGDPASYGKSYGWAGYYTLWLEK